MKILLTGHKGFIGSNFLKALTQHEISTYEWGDDHPIRVEDNDLVIHVGAISSTVETNVEKVLIQNLDFSIWLLNQCIKYGVNFQYSSSASIYGKHHDMNVPFKETDPVDPRSPYAWSKYLFERHVSGLTNTGITIQGFRYFNVYGPGEDHKGNQASPQHKFRQQYEKHGYIELFEGSENFHRDFIHVDHVIAHHLAFMDIPESGVWNVGTGKVKSFVDVANQITNIHRYIKMPKNLIHSYQSYTCADTTKLINTLKKYEKNISNGIAWFG